MQNYNIDVCGHDYKPLGSSVLDNSWLNFFQVLRRAIRKIQLVYRNPDDLFGSVARRISDIFVAWCTSPCTSHISGRWKERPSPVWYPIHSTTTRSCIIIEKDTLQLHLVNLKISNGYHNTLKYLWKEAIAFGNLCKNALDINEQVWIPLINTVSHFVHIIRECSSFRYLLCNPQKENVR